MKYSATALQRRTITAALTLPRFSHYNHQYKLSPPTEEFRRDKIKLLRDIVLFRFSELPIWEIFRVVSISMRVKQ